MLTGSGMICGSAAAAALAGAAARAGEAPAAGRMVWAGAAEVVSRHAASTTIAMAAGRAVRPYLRGRQRGAADRRTGSEDMNPNKPLG
jgi:hypothetical protein